MLDLEIQAALDRSNAVEQKKRDTRAANKGRKALQVAEQAREQRFAGTQQYTRVTYGSDAGHGE